MGKRSSERRQNSGIRQGCPLSPYLFIMLMTVMMRDINSNLTQEERFILRNEQPMGMEGHTTSYHTQTTPLFSLAIGKLRKSYFIKYKKNQVGTT